MEAQAMDEAVSLLSRAIALAPLQLDAHYWLYLCLSRQGRTAEAEKCQARMQQAKKEAKEAKEELTVLTQRLQATPDDADLRWQIAQIFLGKGEEEGLRWLLLNVQNHPNHRPSHLSLAEYYDKVGQTARAAEYRRLAAAARDGR